jgi:purine-nucleoside phosphorylase
MSIPTPHINAHSQDEIAKTVLMPGDPRRAEFIARTFLDNVTKYNEVRGMLGFTGTYKGTRVSVQGSGMGIPSIGIYAQELYQYYDVQNIIRVGSAGAINENLKLRDLVFAMSASTDSNFQAHYGLPGTYAPTASYELLSKAVAIAEERKMPYMVGNILSSDHFYHEDLEANAKWNRMGVLAVEMECAALFMIAARLKRRALGIMTISDIPGVSATTAEERESSFTDMAEVALETCTKL